MHVNEQDVQGDPFPQSQIRYYFLAPVNMYKDSDLYIKEFYYLCMKTSNSNSAPEHEFKKTFTFQNDVFYFCSRVIDKNVLKSRSRTWDWQSKWLASA